MSRGWSHKSLSGKTVFLLDSSPYFFQVSSGHSINIEIQDDPKRIGAQSNKQNIEPFNRSLWTCTIEAVVGYSRLVWDLFVPDQKSIAIFTVNSTQDEPNKPSESKYIEKICSWTESEQNLDHLLKRLIKLSHIHQVLTTEKLKTTDDISKIPNCPPNSIPIISSIEQSLNDLARLTPHQSKLNERIRLSSTSNSVPPEINCGRIILISSFQDEEAIQQLANKCESMIKSKNESIIEALKISGHSLSIAPIKYCDFVVINTYPIGDTGICSKIIEKNIFRQYTHFRSYSVQSGRSIAGLLNNLCLQHYDLKSTIITGIPMKEEQNAKSSSQYDVEIVHCSSIHDGILSSASPFLDGVVDEIDRNGFKCDTFRLSWCTPRSTAVELNHCIATSRITAVDVNSRPSACLTQFLLSGRTVMLEIYKSKTLRMTTHILASHNGELFIHSLASQQSKNNSQDAPAMIEAFGGRVTDYRLKDFTNFMNRNMFCQSLVVENPLKKTRDLLARQTLYWPLNLGITILINAPQPLLAQLLQIVAKESLNQSEIDQAKAGIDQVDASEREGQGLPSVTILELMKPAKEQAKGGNTKLTQLYKLLWNELEFYLRVYSCSSEHEMILDYLMERRYKRSTNERPNKRGASKTLAQSNVPTKKMKSSQQLIPSANLTSPAYQQSLALLKTGMSLWQAWFRLYNIHHQSRAKLTFVGRTRPPKPNNQEPPPQVKFSE